MSKRSNWCEFDKETRKYIKKRDNNECVICHKKGALQVMHIFLSRAKGGKGSKDNGCLGCVKCHTIYDNPIGTEQNEKSKEYHKYCENYLIEKENINYNKEFIETLKYKKELDVFKEINIKELSKQTDRCKNCVMLTKEKNKLSNSTMPTYFCKYKHIFLSKTTKACKKFRRK